MRRLVWMVGAAALTLPATLALAASPVGISRVQVEVRENTVGKEKGTKYVRVHFTATVSETVPKGMTVLVHGECKSDVRSKEGDSSDVGAQLEPLGAGGYKDIAVPLFINDGFHVKPHTCDLVFRYGRFGARAGDRLASFCWSGGVTKEGSCQ